MADSQNMLAVLDYFHVIRFIVQCSAPPLATKKPVKSKKKLAKSEYRILNNK
jgi:hypothetical protein